MVKMLEVNDAAIQKLMLEATGTLLDAGDTLSRSKAGSDNPFLVPFDEAEGVDKLEVRIACTFTCSRGRTRAGIVMRSILWESLRNAMWRTGECV